MNVYLVTKRNVNDAYWMNQAVGRPLLEREFVAAQIDYVPKLNEYGAVPTEVEKTTYYKNNNDGGGASSSNSGSTSSTSSTSASKKNRYNFYRWHQQLR